jgi:uncharacterized protein YprB with RNaseH-like and TPR domain
MVTAKTTMDIGNRLKLLKKERAARARPDSISKTWQQIDRNPDLSTKEKLEKLISLTKTGIKKRERAEPFEPQPRKSLQVFENHFSLRSRYGKISVMAGLKLNGEILTLLSRDKSFEDRDLSSALFLDLETTGLSGGTGVVPFLVGLGFYSEDKFHVVQYFLGDPAEEKTLIEELSRFFSQMDFRSVVSFNGKGFDLPLLETRFILHKQILSLSELPHLDFLFSARSLWSHKQESCRLYHLAREILQAEREEDIPSAEIPSRYFQFLRSGDFSLMEPVLYHNQEDILSLLGVVILGGSFFSEKKEESLEEVADAMDLFGAAKVLEKRGELERSVDYIRRALEGSLSEEIALLAKKKLAQHFKRNQEWEKAISLWQEMTPQNQLFCFRELAMYYEHKGKDYPKAKEIAEEGLALAMGISRAYEEDFAHRLERLRARILRQKKDAD